MKVIQVCGTNGTGKTTLVKGLLNSGNFMRMELPVDGESKEWWFDGRVAVIGRYAQNNCCGVDAGKYSGVQLLKVIDTILDVYGPKAVVFEDVRFGGSYSFKARARDCANRRGYEYVVITLIASLKAVSERVINRSGNEGVNFDQMRSKQRSCITSTRKIANDGVDTYIINSEQKSRNELLFALMEITNE